MPVASRKRVLFRSVLATAGLVALSLALRSPARAGGDPPAEGDQGTVIIAEGAEWQLFRGTQAPPEGWSQPGFDDSAWEKAPTGIGYGDEDDKTILEDMRCTLSAPLEGEEKSCAGGGYLAFFVRRAFQRPEVPEGQKLFVKLSYDDGFVLYLNGVQVRRVNMPDGVVTHETAAASSVGDAPKEADAIIVLPAELLADGENLLAASVHNVNLASTDASFIPRLIVGNPEGEPPPEKTCEERCAASAVEAFQACIGEGLPEAECKARKLAVLEECLQAECGEEPPPETGCKEECSESGNAVFQACLGAGGAKEDCRRRADAIVTLCLERCGVGKPCEDRCAVAAQIILTGCGVAGLPEEECTALANGVLERCVETCEPMESCEGRCEELAAKAVADCKSREGPDAECDDAGAAVLESCLSHCEGEPVPSCDEQCEAKGAELFARCRAEGHSEADCSAKQQSFVEGCKAELGEVCRKENLALESEFQPFLRGDADGDGLVNIGDPIRILGHLFLGGEALGCQDAADANDDGRLDIADPVRILGFLFLGRGQLPEPSFEEGQDPTSDIMLCSS
jgi:hypothetical protein